MLSGGPKRILFACILATGFLFNIQTSSAMTVLAADLPDLIRDSHTIVRAQVTTVQNLVLDTEGNSVDERTLATLDKNTSPKGLRAFTDVTIRILEHYKGEGNEGGTLSFRLVGGTMGPFTLAIPGMPKFQPNTEVVLFLEKTGTSLIPLGASQGVFRIDRTNQGSMVAVHDLKGMAIVRHDVVPEGCNEHTADEQRCAPRTGPGVPAIPERMPFSVLDGQIRAFLGLPEREGLRTAPPRVLQVR